MRRALSLYSRLPLWAQGPAVSAYGLYRRSLRFGGGARRARAELEQREVWSRDELERWTEARLRRLLEHARANAPHYREALAAFDPARFRLADLGAIPLLSKEQVRRRPDDFLTRPASPTHLVYPTSGSTGTPLATVWTVGEYRTAYALREARSARWAGVSFGEPRATFSGRLVVPERHAEGPPYRFNRAERQVYFSVFHLSPRTAPRYVEALHRHRPTWITGYALSIHLLGRYILEQGLRPPPLEAVVTTSEKVTGEMRRIMETAYGCPVFEEYSSVENAVFASECAEHRLHVSTDATLLEILDPDGRACEPGEDGEVVGTNLFRYLQPLVRFRLGDRARWSTEACPCGRALPVIEEVVGRTEDVVVGPDGRRAVLFHGTFLDLPGVREGQIIQERIDRIRVRVATAADYRPEVADEITRRLRQRLGSSVGVVVEPVEAIARTPAGKFRLVISELDRER
jgi:phenylacetate-CoA ligase